MKASLSILLCLWLAAVPTYAQSQQTGDQAANGADQEETTDTKNAWRIPITIGHFMVGSDLLFANANFQKGNDAEYSFGIEPKVGVFVLPGLALGLSMELATSGHKGYSSLDYGISPFARLYFSRGDISERHPLRFFAEANVGVAGTNSWYDDVNGQRVKATTNGFRVGVMPGLDYFLNDHVALETALSYQFITGNPDAQQLALGVGFQVFLGR